MLGIVIRAMSLQGVNVAIDGLRGVQLAPQVKDQAVTSEARGWQAVVEFDRQLRLANLAPTVRRTAAALPR